MSKSTGGGLGSVAVHRWFQTGEGWALHPWYDEQRRPALFTALKQELQNRNRLETQVGRHVFAYPALGGVLFGEHILDKECPDPKAEGRTPTILRAVFLDREPAKLQQDAILRCLREPQPLTPGPDSNLRIPVTPESVGRHRSLRLGSLALAVLLMVGGVWAFSQGWFIRLFGGAEPLSGAAKSIARQLEKWGEPKVGKTTADTIDRFFKLLSLEEFESCKEPLQGEHPDILFVRRLPTNRLSAGKKYTSEAALGSDLQKLLAHLDEVPTAQKARPVNHVIQDIVQRMDYDRWYASALEKGRIRYWGHEKAPEEIMVYARRFASRAPFVWEEPAAKDIRKALQAWMVETFTEEDASKRPRLVMDCFFYFLSRNRFALKPLQGKEVDDDGFLAFVRRLPEVPSGRAYDFADEEDLKKGLRKLAICLRAQESEVAGTLIANIKEAMDYRRWSKENYYPTTGRDVPPEIDAFVKRFQPKATRNP